MASIASQRGNVWIFSFVFVGFVGGIVYNNCGHLVVLVNACTRAAGEHMWDAVCLAMAMAAILMGLLGGKTGSTEDNYPTCDFFTHMLLGLADPDFCADVKAHAEEDDLNTRCVNDHEPSSIATPAFEASIARTHQPSIATSTTNRRSLSCNYESSIACCHHSFIACTDQASMACNQCNHQASIANPHVSKVLMASTSYQACMAFCNTEASKACSCNDQTSTAGADHRVKSEKKQTTYGDEWGRVDLPTLLACAAGSVCVEDNGEVKGVQDLKVGYGVQAVQKEMQVQGRGLSTDQLEDEEYSSNIMECAEISRKADAFIASFREQMRRDMLGDMMLCT